MEAPGRPQRDTARARPSACSRPTARRCITSSFDKTIKVWDLAGKTARYTLKGHTHGRDARSRFRPTARPWRRRPMTRPSGSGTRPPARRYGLLEARRSRSSASPIRPTARPSPRRSATQRCRRAGRGEGLGRRHRRGTGDPERLPPRSSGTWPSRPTAAGWPPAATTTRSSSGTRPRASCGVDLERRDASPADRLFPRRQDLAAGHLNGARVALGRRRAARTGPPLSPMKESSSASRSRPTAGPRLDRGRQDGPALAGESTCR